MTRINKLTQNPELLADDLFVIWDNDNQRTRSITAETLNKFTDANGANAQAFVNGYIQDGILYMVRANDEVVNIGSVTGVELLPEGSIPKVENGKLVASAVKETDDAVVFTKDIIAPQESVFVGPAVKISDKGGYLGVDNLADDRESTPVVSFVYETEAERDAIFADGVSVPKYRYFVPAKWVYQFPFEAEYSNSNKLSFEFQDTDNTLIRKFRMFSKKAQSGVRIWIENLLPSGDAMVWENVTEDDFNEGKGQDFVAQGDTDQFTLVESGLVKISTANIRFRFNVQAQPGENLELQGQELDLGFGTGFYPRMVTYTQDEKDLDLLDSIETSQNRFGQFGEQFRIETSDIVARDLGSQAEDIPQGIFDTAITSDRPETTYVNGDKPIQINAITVKHIGTWSPVQVSLNDDRTQVVDLVDGDNTITFTKPLTVEANQSVYFRFTGAVGTGSQTQISLLGDAQQEIYYKLDITELEEKTVTVDGVESVVAGNKMFVDNSDPKNPIVSWDPSGDLLPGVNVSKDGVQVLSAADTLNFSGSFDVVKAKDTGGTVNIELSTAARGTNEVGVFESTTDLLAAYPTPEDGLYARVLQENNNLPDDRYESKGGSWIGMGGVAGQVIVDANKSLGLIMGDGLKAEDDGGNSKISLDGNTPVLTFDVTNDSTRSVDTTYVGKIINIIQTPPSISIPMQITLVDHSQFKTGDTIKISADRDGDDAYTNYYFAVYFNDAGGRQIAKYPANNITMVRTNTTWDVQLDGRFTNVSIRPKAAFNIPYAPDEQYNTPVNAFVFAESPAVEFQIDEDTNTRIVKVELDKAIPEDPTFKTINIDTFGSGQPNFTAAIKQDSELHTIIDATREFRVQYKDIGTGISTSVFGIDNNQAQFLVPIYQGADKVALEKDVPLIPDAGYVENYSQADLKTVQVAYQGKYGDDRNFYPASTTQDSNGWVQEEFTGTKVIRSKDANTGAVGDKVLELTPNRVTHRKQPYFNDDRLATRTNNHIANTTSFNDLIYTNGQNVNEWIADNPDYTPAQLLDIIFACKVLGLTNWIVSATTSNNNYNGTFPTSYQQIELHKTGGSARNFMRAYNKESPTHYFAPHKAGEAPVWKVYAYQEDISNEIAADKAKGIWIGGVIKDTLTDGNQSSDEFKCTNPKHFIEFKKTNVAADFFRFRQSGSAESSSITVHLHPDSGLSNQRFRFTTADGKYQEKSIKSGDTWRFYLRKGDYPYYERVQDGTASSYAYEGQGLGVPEFEYVTTQTINQSQPVGLYYNALNDGSSIGDIELSKDDGYREFQVIIHGMTKTTRDWRVGTGTPGRFSDKRVRTGEVWQCRVMVDWNVSSNTQFYWTRLDDGTAGYILEDEFNAKSGYSALVSGGGSTKTVTYGDNAKILKISNATVKVELLQGMNADTRPHGYFKYINSHNADVAFEWYDRAGNRISNNVPSVCPKDTVVEVFADYAKDEYVLNFSQSKVISSTISQAQEPQFKKFINESTVNVDYPINADGNQYRPQNVVVTVLDTDNLISELNINVTSSDGYSGHYNSVGSISIDSSGQWSTESRRNAYRLDDGTNTYCVFSDSLNAWVLIVSDVDHNHTGSSTGGVPVNLYNDGQLPSSHGDYSIENNLDSIDSEYFTQADVDIDYHTNSDGNSYFVVKFGSAKPAGIVFYR